MSRARLLSAVALGAALGPGAAAADAGGWARLDPPGAPPASIATTPDGARLVADGAVGFAHRPLRVAAGDALVWRWRVDAAPPPGDPGARGADDRPVAVHLWLDAGPGPSLFGRVAELLGYPRVTHALTWQWGGLRPEGAMLANPHHPAGAIIVLRGADAPLGVWRAERRDVAADLAAAFGGRVGPQHVRRVALSIDTEDRGGRAAARVEGLRVEPAGALP